MHFWYFTILLKNNLCSLVPFVLFISAIFDLKKNHLLKLSLFQCMQCRCIIEVFT